MGFETGISWVDSTFNCWIGCTKVSDGCKFCYAETLNKRWDGGNWGPGAPRRITSDKNWNEPVRWNKLATKEGRRHRVFSASLADIFDDEAPEGGRERLFALIEATPNLDWLLLTKRTENIIKMLPPTWLENPRPNVWLGTSVEDNRVRGRIDILAAVPAAVRFLSIEPMLGPIEYPESAKNIHWMIYGGESGNMARRLDPQWIRDGVSYCHANGIAPFVKQLGQVWAKTNKTVDRSAADPLEWPEDLRVQEFPGAPHVQIGTV